MHRLAYILSAALLLVSCKSKQRQADSPSNQQPQPAPSPQPITLSETYDLPEGNYKAFTATLTRKQTLEIDLKVLDGKGVDLLVMTEDNFKLWAANKQYRYFPAMSSERTVEYNRRFALDAGKFCIVTRAPGKRGDELPVGVLVDLFTGNYVGAFKGATKDKPANLTRVKATLNLYQ